MKAKLTFIIILILLIAGCKAKEGPLVDIDFRKGITSLEMDFIKNAPPKEIFEKDNFQVYLNLKNSGAYDIENGYLTIGFEETYMALDSWSIEKPIISEESKKTEKQVKFNLKGRSLQRNVGEQGIVSVKMKGLNIDELSEMHASDIMVTACYPYQTIAATTVCIDTNVYDTKIAEKPCKAKALTFTGQGAPLVVRSIETEMLPHDNENMIKPRFVIELENKGKGQVIKGTPDIIEKACSSASIDFNELNAIYITAKLSDKLLVCAPKEEDGSIRLRNKIETITCSLEQGIDKATSTYSAPLEITLDYGYTYTISKTILIKKALKY